MHLIILLLQGLNLKVLQLLRVSHILATDKQAVFLFRLAAAVSHIYFIFKGL